MTDHGMVFGDAAARRAVYLLLVRVGILPADEGIAVVVLAVEIDMIFAHEFYDPARRPRKTLLVSEVVGRDIAAGNAPFLLVAEVFFKVLGVRHALRLKPHESFRAVPVRIFHRFAKAVAAPFFAVKLPCADRAPPVGRDALAARVEVPARVEPTEVERNFFGVYPVERAAPCEVALGDAAVGVREPRVARKAGGGEGHYRCTRGIGTRHIVFHEPTPPEI